MIGEQASRDERIKAMKLRIFRAEQENLKTRARTTDQMVEVIRRIIAEEAKKNY